MIDEPHTISTVADTGDTITRECSCGWWTIGTVPEPDYHTPLAQREADHLAEMAKLVDGSIMQEVPPGHEYRLYFRYRASDHSRNHVVINAVWTGGFREVELWRWDSAGLAEAQAWCDQRHVVWQHSGFPVQPGQLLTHQ